MKMVYVVTEASSPEDRHVVGVFTSVELAKAAVPGTEWGFWGNDMDGRAPDGNDITITSYELDSHA